MLKALQFKSGSRDAFNIFSPYDLFIFPINYTTVSEEHCENIHVYDRVIIRWHKKLRRNDKEIKEKKILRYFFLGGEMRNSSGDDREESRKIIER
jgi:hypothetical protein